MAEVDLNQCDTEKCENCQSPYFKECIIIKNVPGIVMENNLDTYIPVKFFACEKCGMPHKSMRIDINTDAGKLKIDKNGEFTI